MAFRPPPRPTFADGSYVGGNAETVALLRGNRGLARNVATVRNDVRLTAMRRGITMDDVLQRREEFEAFRADARDARGIDAQGARNAFATGFRGVPLASVFFNRDGQPTQARIYDQQLPFNADSEHVLYYMLAGRMVNDESAYRFGNAPIRGGRFRIEIEYNDENDILRTRTIETTMPNFQRPSDVARFINDTPTLYWALRETSDVPLDLRSIRIFPVLQWTGGRAPRLNALLDGPNHCFFSPIIRHYQDKIAQGVDKKNYEVKLRKVINLREKFDTGVSIENVPEISEKLKATFVIKDLHGNELFSNKKSVTNVKNLFEYVYSDYNHVTAEFDLVARNVIGEIIESGTYDPILHSVNSTSRSVYLSGKSVVEVNYTSMQNIRKFLTENKLFFCYRNNNGRELSSIKTFGTCFRLAETRVETLTREFFNSIKPFRFNYHHSNPAYHLVKNCYIQKVQYPYQSKERQEELLQLNELHEFDLIKAYANSDKCPYYMQFPTVLNHMVMFSQEEQGVDFDVCDYVQKHIGFYGVVLLTPETVAERENPWEIGDVGNVEKNRRLVKHLEKWGILPLNGMYYFTSPMIVFLVKEMGCLLRLVYGTYSIKPTDIVFSDEIKTTKVTSMIDERINGSSSQGPSLYAVLVGKMAMERQTNENYFYCSEEFCKEVSCKPDEAFDFRATHYLQKASDPTQLEAYGELKLEKVIPKSKKWNYLPIAAYVISYTFITVFNEVIKLDVDDVLAVKVDSILMKKDKTIDNPLFRPKTAKALTAPVTDPYFPTFHTSNVCVEFITVGDHPIENEFVIGQGGSGKTYHFIDDIKSLHYKYLDPLYVCPSNKLKQYKATSFVKDNAARVEAINAKIANPDYCDWVKDLKKMRKYVQKNELKCCTVAKLIGEQCSPYIEDSPPPGCIIVDESTMLFENQYQKIKTMYPYSRIYFLGDFAKGPLRSFQATIDNVPGKTPLSMKGEPFEFNQDKRCVPGDQLRNFKRKFREWMQNDKFPIPDVLRLIHGYPCKTIVKEELPFEYNDNDICIAYTKEKCIEYTELLKDKAPIYRIETSVVCKNTGKQFFTGDMLTSLEGLSLTQSSYKVTRCFTAHSIQGETVDPPKRIFLPVADLLREKHRRVFYTAISRARRLDQIVFVFEKEEPKVGSKRPRPE